MRRRIRAAALPLHRHSLPQLAVVGALVALGTPVYTTFEGRLGAVDERLLSERRLRKLTDPDELSFAKRAPDAIPPRARRDPDVLVELLLSPLTTVESP